MYGGNQGQNLYKDLWQYNIVTNMWQKLTISEKLQGLAKEDNYKNCTICKECSRCDWRDFPRSNCSECFECYHNEHSPDDYTRLTCNRCRRCEWAYMHEDSYRYDCHTCKYCYKCYDGVSLQVPPGLKGHSMVASRHGVVIFGGITWNKVNMDKADELGK